MAFKHGKATTVLFNEYDMSAFLNTSDTSADQDNPVTTTYGATGVRRTVVGLRDGSMTFGGFHDAVAGGSHPIFTAALGAATAVIVTRGVEGLGSIGLPAELMSSRQNNYSTGAPVDGVVPCAVSLEGDGGVDFGKCHKALSATTATGDSTSINNGAATANGGVGQIHATAISGTPTLDAKIQHSTDDAAWVDLITFAQLTAIGKQRVEVAAGTTVNQYTRETHTVGGGSPSVTYAAAFARR